MLVKTSIPAKQEDQLRYLKGIGPKRALALEKLGIRTVSDLLYLFPRRYEDRTRLRSIASIIPGEHVTVRAEILTAQLKRFRKISMLEVGLGDKSGMIYGVWFNQPYLKNYLTPGKEIFVYGRADLNRNKLQFSSPEFELLDGLDDPIHMARITPIYPLTSGLFQKSLRAIQKDLVENRLDKILVEWLPQKILKDRVLIDLRQAVTAMHFPDSFDSLHLARKRIVFDEFFRFQLLLIHRMDSLKQNHTAYPIVASNQELKQFKALLPFRLTKSQDSALLELMDGLAQKTPMNRILQGDVGSGKTVVAAFALLLTARLSHQAALLVPTELLAYQHYRTLIKILEPFNVSVSLLTANTPSSKKEKILGDLKENRLSIVVGTHALLSEKVKFSKLALLVIDEQHKFGVHQRHHLLQSTPRPHQLVMTATPIPRTLALTLYGDLDLTLLTELPVGRKPVKTILVPKRDQITTLAEIRKRIEAGDQAYFIFPVIEQTENSDLLAATKEFDRLRQGPFAGLKIGLVHGRLKPEERDIAMRRFEQGELQILIATSVIEVGIHNPNATVMVIENAERFGLSQLHQMRGRIGRGEKPSQCFLFSDPKSEDSRIRLEIMTKTQDGFLIADEDLKLRGPGDFWGTKQSGDFPFKVANLVTDQSILEAAKWEARTLLRADLTNPELLGIKKVLEQFSLKY